MNLEKILSEAKENDSVDVTIVTNQAYGIVGYATGSLVYRPASFFKRPFYPSAQLSTAKGEPLEFHFSNRMINIGTSPRSFGRLQPFSVNEVDKLDVFISLQIPNKLFVMFTLLSWQNARFSILFEKHGDLFIGTGASIGNSDNVSNAGYLISFGKFGPRPVVN